ncbi:hypothetical protein K353_06564 [Kitasatospora sp. SolWspMP-SS2h]|uniref:hypothetical protein n=1 Tax=Kitasatospora sp. SolWspMP-SS2h TaxID=1305729 RepID=UPI000DBA03D9|nr:hypothetical protein [Kitasatospora sp. SolWspMP-SS2h]RAJ29676.1 hypothetical protein K353_06564 [Kitasatospora sp. SolWspMP-SS2h]
MEPIISTADGVWPPWPELMPGHRPVLVAPADPARPTPSAEGWRGAEGGGPRLEEGWSEEGWSALFDGRHLAVRRPCGTPWYDGPLAATREWTRAARTHHTLLIVTGQFTTAFDFPPAAAAGRLLTLAVPIRLTDPR